MRLDIRRFPVVTSTMDLAAEAVNAGAAEGVVIVADEQTAGRGRRGRTWSSPAGAGLYVSFVFRPLLDGPGGAPVLSLVTLTAGVALHEAIATVSGFQAELKWPNDVMVGRRKLAGVLAEGLAIGTADQAVVLGLGINVLRSSYPPAIVARATSLENELGRPIDRDQLLDAVLRSVCAWYGRLRGGEAGDILRAWRAVSPSAIGAAVEWNEGRARGVTAGLDAAGALLVKAGDRIERIISGELRWL